MGLVRPYSSANECKDYVTHQLENSYNQSLSGLAMKTGRARESGGQPAVLSVVLHHQLSKHIIPFKQEDVCCLGLPQQDPFV